MVTERMRRLPGAIALAITLAFGATGGCGSSPGVAGPGKLVVLHTNDIHGKFRDTPATWKSGNPPIGGFANLSAYVEAERAANPGRVLLLDAGDLMTGNPICDLEHEGVRGGAMIAFMNAMRYDATCLGNHEFDNGLDALDARLSLATIPVLSANTYRAEGGTSAPARYVIVERAGVRIGIIGLMTEALYSVAAPSKLAGTVVTSAAEAAREIVAEIDGDTDVIVLLTHIGVHGDRRLARQVKGIDLIVGGHSHTRLTKPEVVEGVVIVQAGAHNRNLGRLVISVADDRIVSHEGELIDLWPRKGGSPEIVAMVDAYSEAIDLDYGGVIGRLETAWTRASHGESNIGNWITDQMREYTGADFAVLNSGGIRKNVPAGPISRLDVLEVLPFSNVITTFTCTGRELFTLMRHNAHAAVHETHGILQVSGMRYRFARENDDVRILEATIGGSPVDPDATYTGTSVDYITHGNAERLLGFEPTRTAIEGTVLSSVIVEAIERSPTIDARVEGRMDARKRIRRVG